MRTQHSPQLPTEELVFRVVGELDVASVAALRAELRRTIAAAPGPVVLDLTAMTFIDAAGLAALVWFACEMSKHDRRVSVHGANQMASRLLDLTRIGHLFYVRKDAPSW